MIASALANERLAGRVRARLWGKVGAGFPGRTLMYGLTLQQ